MGAPRKSDLDSRLEDYFATLRFLPGQGAIEAKQGSGSLAIALYPTR